MPQGTRNGQYDSLSQLLTATEVMSHGRCIPVQRARCGSQVQNGRCAPGVHLASATDAVAVLLGITTSTKPIRFQVLSDKLHFNWHVDWQVEVQLVRQHLESDWLCAGCHAQQGALWTHTLSCLSPSCNAGSTGMPKQQSSQNSA